MNSGDEAPRPNDSQPANHAPATKSASKDSCCSERLRQFLLTGNLSCDKEATHALAPLASLFTLFLVEVAGATIREQGKGGGWNLFLTSYAIVGTCTVMVMFVIARVTKGGESEQKSRIYSYDRGTLIAGNAISWTSLVLLLAFIAFCYKGCLPGQKPLCIERRQLQIEETVSAALPGLKLDFYLSDKNFGGEMPQNAQLNVTLSDKWRVAATKAEVEEYSSSGKLIPAQAVVDANDSPDCGEPTTVMVRGLRNGPLYLVTLFLEPRGDDYDDDTKKIYEAKNKQTHGSAVSIKDIKRKWKKWAESQKTIFNNEGLPKIEIAF